jgi:hypothetical protein
MKNLNDTEKKALQALLCAKRVIDSLECKANVKGSEKQWDRIKGKPLTKEASFIDESIKLLTE